MRRSPTKKANLGPEGWDSNLREHTCTISTGLGHKEKPAFRIDVLKHVAKGG